MSTTSKRTSAETSATKCFANFHMTAAEHGFWEVCRSLSYPYNYRLIFNGPKLTECFSGENKNHIYRLVKQLVAKGWFVVLTKPKRGIKGMWEPGTYQVLSHEEWLRTDKGKDNSSPCKTPFPESGLDELNSGLDRSRNQEHTVPGIGNTPFPESGNSTDVKPYTYIKPDTDALSALHPGNLKKEGSQEALCDSEHVPPFPNPGTAAELPFPKSGTVDPYAGSLEFSARRWSAKRSIGRALSQEEIAELQRRNGLKLTPETLAASTAA